MRFLTKKYSIILLLTPLLLLPIVASAEIGFMEEALWSIVSGFFGLFVGFAGALLDYSLEHFVIGFGTFWSSGTVGSSVDTLWVNVRDIFNITFIFGLVYIGFKMILDSDSSTTKRALIYLIMAALLVNFSLFFTKAVIDVSNMLATEIAYDGLPIVDGVPSISTAFMGGTGLTSILNPDDLADVIDSGGLSYIFGAMIFYIVSIFVFASGAFLLFIRFGTLLLYMIFSPFMFIGWVFPQLNSYTIKYWRGFLGRAFFAPLYLLLVFLSMTVLTNYVTSLGTGSINLADGFSDVSKADVSNNFPPFIIASILMLASVIIASKLGADGAKGAISVGKNITGRAKRNIRKGAAWTGRRSIQQTGGRAYRRGANYVGGKTSAQITKWQQKERTSATGKTLRGFANNRLVDKGVRKFGAKMENAKGGFKETTKEMEDRKKQERDTIRDRNENYQKYRDGDAAAIRNLSKKDLENLQKNDKELFMNVIASRSLKDSTFNALKDSDVLNKTEKDELKKARKDALREFAVKNEKAVSENIQQLTVGQIETLGDEFITDNAHLFSASTIESLKKNDKFTDEQEKERKEKIVRMSRDPELRNQLFNNNTTANPEVYDTPRKAKDIANLPFTVFLNEDGTFNQHSVSQINPDVLGEMAKNKTLSVSEREQIKAEILRNGTEQSRNYLNTPEGQKNWNIGAQKPEDQAMQGLASEIRGLRDDMKNPDQASSPNQAPPPGYSEIPGESGIVTQNNPSQPRENRNNT